MNKVVIVGGGASGMMAAISAALNGNKVLLYDKNEKLGKKLYITGKGRCNITNACDMETLMANMVSNSKFLYSAFYGYNNYDVMDFFEKCGLKLKIERGNRVFPESDKSSDIIAALTKELRKLNVEVYLNTPVKELVVTNDKCVGILLNNKEIVQADAVIVATGGLSYQTTGSTGDGYKFARKLGHTITNLMPALVPINTQESFVKDLQGLSLKNISVTISNGKKQLYQEFGEMLFTHYGVSGPVLLSASSFITRALKETSLTLSIDLKPALNEEQLDTRLLRDFEEFKNKQFKNALTHLFPSKLIPVMVNRSGINPDKKVNEITKEERVKLIGITKEFQLTLVSLRDYNEAIITQGGISIKEINPATMESKLIAGLYFVGEVLDLDAVTGGFNLQIAWSTGYAAGTSI